MLRTLLLVSFAVAAAGCGSKGPVLVPVTGKVVVNVRPAEHAVVVLHPATPTDLPKPRGTVTADGSFTLTTHTTGGTNALFADGSVRFVTATVNIRTLAAFVTRNGARRRPPSDSSSRRGVLLPKYRGATAEFPQESAPSAAPRPRERVPL